MTVRAWFTISAVALGVLAVAFALRFSSPAKAPRLFASVGATRLEAAYRGSCWPQPGGRLRCERDPGRKPADGPRITGRGTLRVVADYPVQPTGGTIMVSRAGARDPVIRSDWENRLPYELDPGAYVMRADARYPPRGYVRYDFAFVVR